MATDKTIYRSSTTAPVNIAVIKSEFPHTPNPQGSSTVTPVLTAVQILGKERCHSQPPYQLFPLRNPVAERPPRVHDRIVLSNLPRRRRRHAHPELTASEHPGLKAHPCLSRRPAFSPSGPRRIQPLSAKTLLLSAPYRLREQLPYRCGASEFCGRVCCARPRCR